MTEVSMSLLHTPGLRESSTLENTMVKEFPMSLFRMWVLPFLSSSLYFHHFASLSHQLSIPFSLVEEDSNICFVEQVFLNILEIIPKDLVLDIVQKLFVDGFSWFNINLKLKNHVLASLSLSYLSHTYDYYTSYWPYASLDEPICL